MTKNMAIINRYPTKMHQRIYPASVADNSLRRLAVDIAVWKFDSATFKELGQGLWDKLFVDLAMRLHELSNKGSKGPAPFLVHNCHYHEHVAAKKPCYKTMFP